MKLSFHTFMIAFWATLIGSMAIFTGNANAYIQHPPVVLECPPGTDGAGDGTTGYCVPLMSYLPALYGAGGQFGPTFGGSNAFGSFAVYVPYPGNYSVRVYICPATVKDWCTIKGSADSVDSAKALYHNTTETISYQNQGGGRSFGGANTTKTIPYSFTTCLVFVAEDGTEWASNKDVFTCQDAYMLPDYPAICYLNYDGSPLNVHMGTLERGMIATSPQTTPMVKSSISILCTRESATNVEFQFQFSPESMAGIDVIPTKLNGIGIALYYQGKPVSPSDKFYASYEKGFSSLEVEFEAIRNPGLNIGEIGTGEFETSAVLVMNVI